MHGEKDAEDVWPKVLSFPSSKTPSRMVDMLQYCSDQSWGRYFKNVTNYILLVTFRQCNYLQLHITVKK